MKTTKNDVTKVVCNNCKKSTYSVTGKGKSGMATYLKGKELSWRWINKQNQICPSCRKTAEKANGSTKKASKKVAKTERKPIVLFGKKAKIGSNPITAGQSTGKLARSAKVAALPSAE